MKKILTIAMLAAALFTTKTQGANRVRVNTPATNTTLKAVCNTLNRAGNSLINAAFYSRTTRKALKAAFIAHTIFPWYTAPLYAISAIYLFKHYDKTLPNKRDFSVSLLTTAGLAASAYVLNTAFINATEILFPNYSYWYIARYTIIGLSIWDMW